MIRLIKNKSYFLYFTIFLSICLIVYVFLRSEIYYEGSRRNFYISYYLFGFFSLILSVVLLFIQKEVFEYIKIFIITVTFTLYLSEIYLLIKKYPLIINYKNEQKFEKKLDLYFKNTGKLYDTRSRKEIFKDELKKGNIVKIPIPPTNYIKKNDIKLFPLSGLSNKKTLFCNESGYFAFYNSDRYGFRNQNEMWNSEIIEYLLIGDSFTHGACVNKNIADNLISLSNKSVLNLGYVGNGSLINYAVIKEYLPNNVKNLIWFYYEGNDKDDLILELENYILVKYLKDSNFSQNLKEKQWLVDEINENEMISEFIRNEKQEIQEKESYQIKKHFNLKRLIILSELRNFFLKNNKKQLKIENDRNDRNDRLSYKNFELILKKTKKILDKNNTNFIFVYLPEFKRIVNKLGIKFIDINEGIFSKLKNPKTMFPFEMNNHYTEEAYSKISNYIYKKIN